MVRGTITTSDINTVRMSLPEKNSAENTVFFSYEYRDSSHLRLSTGLRLSQFSLLGPGPFYTYNSYNFIDSVKSTVDSTTKVMSYFKPEPVFSQFYYQKQKIHKGIICSECTITASPVKLHYRKS